MAKGINERMKAMRERRKAEAWKEVRVWVPSEKEAVELQELAAEMRKRAEVTETIVMKQYRLVGDTPKIELVNVHVFPLVKNGAFAVTEARRFAQFVSRHEKGLFRRAEGDEAEGWIACHPASPKLAHHDSLADFIDAVTPKKAVKSQALTQV